MNVILKPIHQVRWTNQTNKTKYFVIHWIVGTQKSTDRTFPNAQGTASYHYTISSDGEIHQHVDSTKIAHHAGDWQANTESIGISLEGGWMKDGERVKPTAEAHKAAGRLIRDLAEKHDIKISRQTVKKHSEVRPEPTECPGSTDINKIIKVAKDKKYNMDATSVRQQIAEMFLAVYKVPPRMIHIRYEQSKIMKDKANTSEKRARLERLRQVYVAARKNEEAEKDYIKHHWNPYAYLWSHGGLRDLYGVTEMEQINQVVEQNYQDLIRHYIDYGIPEDHGDEMTEGVK